MSSFIIDKLILLSRASRPYKEAMLTLSTLSSTTSSYTYPGVSNNSEAIPLDLMTVSSNGKALSDKINNMVLRPAMCTILLKALSPIHKIGPPVPMHKSKGPIV